MQSIIQACNINPEMNILRTYAQKLVLLEGCEQLIHVKLELLIQFVIFGLIP